MAAVFPLLEHAFLQDAVVEQIDRKPLNQRRPEHLDQIQRQGVARVLGLVQHAETRMQPAAHDQRGDVAGQQGGDAGERQVHRIRRRPAAAVHQRPAMFETGAERRPVEGARAPLHAHQPVPIRLFRDQAGRACRCRAPPWRPPGSCACGSAGAAKRAGCGCAHRRSAPPAPGAPPGRSAPAPGQDAAPRAPPVWARACRCWRRGRRRR